ncbi:hypothetical protein XENOCAPTIV_019560 [Xenoophorus captivus]|uniref:Uncharacterized protein n=1 Tax=Xenoophorus captivus TaxID=1517983 RepID=A0ABV0RIB8_9TELE
MLTFDIINKQASDYFFYHLTLTSHFKQYSFTGPHVLHLLSLFEDASPHFKPPKKPLVSRTPTSLRSTICNLTPFRCTKPQAAQVYQHDLHSFVQLLTPYAKQPQLKNALSPN